MRRACLDELGAHANGLLAGHGWILIAQIGSGIAEGMLTVYMRIARGVCVADVLGSWELGPVSFTALRICATVRLCDAAVIRAPDDHGMTVEGRGGPWRTRRRLPGLFHLCSQDWGWI